MRPEEQVSVLTRRVKIAEDEARKLRDEKNKMLDAISEKDKTYGAFTREVQSLRVAAGTTALEGPGIVITIDDTRAPNSKNTDLNSAALLTHDVDLLMLVNELHAAEAEAIMVNDQRVIGSSAIRCAGPVIQVNSQPISAPFIFKVIGKPDVLNGAVNLPTGILEQLKAIGIHVKVEKRDKIQVPAIPVLPELKVGAPVPTVETTDKP